MNKNPHTPFNSSIIQNLLSTKEEKEKSLYKWTKEPCLFIIISCMEWNKLISHLIRRLGLGPVEKLLLLWSLIIKCEHHLPCFTNLVAATDHWFFSWPYLSWLLYYHCVSSLSTWHKFSSIGNLPAYYSCLPHKGWALLIPTTIQDS